MNLILTHLDDWMWPLATMAGAVVLGILAYLILRPIARRVSRHALVAGAVNRQLDKPMRWLFPLLALQIALEGVPDGLPHVEGVRQLASVLLIAAFTVSAIAAVRGVADAVVVMHPQDVADNLAARRVLTQTRVLSRIAIGIVLFAGLAFILMTFPRARQFGTSLLASAGLSALVIGLAAKSVFGNLLAGLQIALSQPIRIDDVLIVQGEWGRVEEITSTYVVLKIWDERRLVIPLQWFIDNPFQNWTRTTSQIIGSVFFWLDYATDLEPLRAEATRLAQSSKDYDGRVCLLQVVDTSESAMKLRLIASSASAGQNWDLCCLLREGLVAFLRSTQPLALPRTRVDVRGLPADPPAPAAPAAPHAASPAPELEARLAGQRTDAGTAEVNNDTGITSLTAPTGGVVPPARPPR
ncbi:MAG: mechanosensitive ion channel domain-containing protein [Burkholderiaceae bacterium]